MSLKDRLKSAGNRSADSRNLLTRFGVRENPFPPASQNYNNPHFKTDADEKIDVRIESFIRDHKSQVVVIEGTQGVGKTNLLNHYERELAEVLPELQGFYVIRYLADPEASFDGTLRRLFQELGNEHLKKLGVKLHDDGVLATTAIEQARSRDMKSAMRYLATSNGHSETISALLDWLQGLRVLNRHRDILGVQFRLDTVESKTLALRDLVYVSSAAGCLNGIFLLLDELEKQDGTLGPTQVVRYLSAMRAIIDALPNHLFLIIAITPDALRRYSVALPAFRSRLEDKIELSPLSDLESALELAHFYIEAARSRAEQEHPRSAAGRRRPILTDEEIERIFTEKHRAATERGDTGLRQREFLHALHVAAEQVIQR